MGVIGRSRKRLRSGSFFLALSTLAADYSSRPSPVGGRFAIPEKGNDPAWKERRKDGRLAYHGLPLGWIKFEKTGSITFPRNGDPNDVKGAGKMRRALPGRTPPRILTCIYGKRKQACCLLCKFTHIPHQNLTAIEDQIGFLSSLSTRVTVCREVQVILAIS